MSHKSTASLRARLAAAEARKEAEDAAVRAAKAKAEALELRAQAEEDQDLRGTGVEMEEEADEDDDAPVARAPAPVRRTPARSVASYDSSPSKKSSASKKSPAKVTARTEKQLLAMFEELRVDVAKKSPEKQAKCSACGNPGHNKSACSKQEWPHTSQSICAEMMTKLLDRPDLLELLLAKAQEQEE